ncbi:pathogen-related protein-like [Benincasa hispida]|uniref:pathogen-related protein-like n=1 Tax=Benincasa hispida TaxID=102211 RepID=UPI001900BEEE|nr:pathogen-related protein-like [Benincasa hispida]
MESIKMSPEETITVVDKYRVFLNLKDPTIQWRNGKPPTYESLNKFFEDGRTKEWPKGSLEETVQNIIKSSQMEFAHKTRLQDFETINPQKFNFFVNGREGLSGEETMELGVFNALLKNSLPEKFHYFKVEEETFESTRNDFKTCFPRGFAFEVMEVYSPPPLIAYKFRHWGFFEGPYKTHSPTGQLVQFYGLGILKVNLSMKIEEVHIYYDPTELLGGLLKGKNTASESKTQHNNDKDLATSVGCPFSKAQ